ncbi:hypothetical protein [Marinobacter sp.]|uniref:hypothetical protein n=1 Tax=Marinobacter sp. TaxID=50741 RepID=UPI002B275517|nr:hypothetical protein [Marinobacter sp.]
MKLALKITESILAWIVTLIVVLAFSRTVRFGTTSEVVIDALMLLSLPLVWGVSSLTFWHRDETAFSYSQALAFPASLVLGLVLSLLVGLLPGIDLSSIEYLLSIVAFVIIAETFIEKRIAQGRQPAADLLSKSFYVGASTVMLGGLVGLFSALLYGRLRMEGMIVGYPLADNISLFIFNDAYDWFLNNG